MEESLGEPDLTLPGFQLWMHRREFPDAHDYFDGNVLHTTARAEAEGCSILVRELLLEVWWFERFGEACAALHRGESERATLDPWEPNLCLSLQTSDRPGHLEMQLELTPDHLAQVHQFTSEIDQSHLPEVVRACEAIVEKYPVRGR